MLVDVWDCAPARFLYLALASRSNVSWGGGRPLALLRLDGVVLGFRHILVWRVPYTSSYGIFGLPWYEISVVLFPQMGVLMRICLRVHAWFVRVVFSMLSLELGHSAHICSVDDCRFRVLFFCTWCSFLLFYLSANRFPPYPLDARLHPRAKHIFPRYVFVI